MDLVLDRNVCKLIFGENEELPLGLWADLVKWRAKYRCQQCGVKLNHNGRSNLVSHHKRATCDGGKSTLANGRCLCTVCHSGYRTLETVTYSVSKFGELRRKLEEARL